MTALVSSELLKLRSTRTFYGVTGAALLLILLIVGLTSAFVDFSEEPDAFLGQVSVGGFMQIFALVIGLLAVSTEFRHGTITPSLLAVPNRTQFMIAKVIANGLAGLLLGLAVSMLCVVIAGGLFSLRDIDGGSETSEVIKTILGNTAASGLFAVLGVGVGALLRNQAGAIVAALVYLLLIEGLLGLIPGLEDTVPKYGINGVTTALSGGDDTFDPVEDQLSQGVAGLIFAGYALAFAAAGTIVLRRRDVS